MRMGLRLQAVTGALVRTGQSTIPIGKAGTTMTTITIAQVVDKAIELAEAKPDYVYVLPDGGDQISCSYVPRPGSPDGCIFGQALRALGVSEKGLKQFEQRARASGTGIVILLTHLGIIKQLDDLMSLPLALRRILNAQRAQDCGGEWGGECLDNLRAAKAALS